MKRKWHYLKPNDNNETMQSCIFVDTETDEIKVDKIYTGHRLRFGWACATRRNKAGEWTKPEWKRFTDGADFWLWAMQHTRSRVKTWMWVHNASFDYPVLDAFSALPDLAWTLHSAIIDSPPTVIKYRSGSKTLMLCDTLNIWRMSLAELGKKVGLEKLHMPDKWGEEVEDDAYCVRDVDIIRRAVCDWSDFLRSNDMGGFCPTIAAQSLRSFRHRYMRDRILIEANDLSLGLARSCYHGGRCEAGYIGELHQPVHYLDVNSMYPFVMSYTEMPLRLVGITRFCHVHQLARLLKKYCCCAHVRLRTPEAFACIIHQDRLCFPVGVFDAYLTTPELLYALERNYIEEVHLCASYEKGVPFREFALDLYAHKETAARAGNQNEASQWKLLLNSFYGKWGQSGRKWVEVACDPAKQFLVRRDINAQTGKQALRRYFGGIVSVRAEDGESAESHPAIAAHITSEARMILFALIRQLAPQDYFYCDTDSLFVSDKGLETLRNRLDQYKLGGLKHVKTFNEVRIYGAKDLVCDGEQKTKGISKKAEQLDYKTYRQLRWFSLRGLLRKGQVSMPLTIPITKSLSRLYTKGTIGPDGFVSPLHFGGAI